MCIVVFHVVHKYVIFVQVRFFSSSIHFVSHSPTMATMTAAKKATQKVMKKVVKKAMQKATKVKADPVPAMTPMKK